MSRSINLLPQSVRQHLQWRQQSRFWFVAWLVVSLLLAIVLAFLDHTDCQAKRDLQDAELEVIHVRQAEAAAQRLSGQIVKARNLVQASHKLEQTDVPLALIQIVGQCCHSAGTTVRLQSLRLNEIAVSSTTQGTPTNITHHRPVNRNSNSQQITRKQLMLAGEANPEACLTLVGLLRDSGAFGTVELMSSQALNESAGQKQSFQIRCEQ